MTVNEIIERIIEIQESGGIARITIGQTHDRTERIIVAIAIELLRELESAGLLTIREGKVE